MTKHLQNASQRGRSNRRRGHDAERELAKWLRLNGWPHAERSVRTGFRVGGRIVHDHGDITGTPALVWQVKHVQREDIADWMAETEGQRVAAGAEHGVLMQRRIGHASPGRWWAWMQFCRVAALQGVYMVNPDGDWPVRMELQHLVLLLHFAGYGMSAGDLAAIDEDHRHKLRADAATWTEEDR